MSRQGRLILVRAAAAPEGMPGERAPWDALAALTPRDVTGLEVAADWKVVVEQWLESPRPHQHFAAPNQLLEIRREGALILQVTPTAAGRSRIRRFDFAAAGAGQPRPRRAARDPRQRQADAWLKGQIELAESTQAGLVGAAGEAVETGPVSPALAQFRARIAALLQERSAN